MKASVRLN